MVVFLLFCCSGFWVYLFNVLRQVFFYHTLNNFHFRRRPEILDCGARCNKRRNFPRKHLGNSKTWWTRLISVNICHRKKSVLFTFEDIFSSFLFFFKWDEKIEYTSSLFQSEGTRYICCPVFKIRNQNLNDF
jgi:hypothetical protein